MPEVERFRCTKCGNASDFDKIYIHDMDILAVQCRDCGHSWIIRF